MMANWGRQGGWTNTYSYEDMRTLVLKTYQDCKANILSAKELDEFERRWLNVIVLF
jgi:hypothetical protein